MRQFKYFHNPETSKYESIITKSNNEKVERDIFNKLRDYDALENSYSFAYYPNNEDVYFFQTAKKDQTFSHGLVGKKDEVIGLPTEYIGLLDKDFKNSDCSGVLPTVNMPRLSARPDLKNLQFIFPELIDALLYANKRIIIVGETLTDLAKYINALYNLLPANFVRNYSFALGTNRVNPNTSSAPVVQMNIILTTSLEAYNQWQSTYIVFNVANNSMKTNYNQELHSYAKAIKAIESDIRSWNQMRIKRFIADVEQLFANGLPKDEDLELLIAVLNFDEKNDYNSAKSLVEQMIKHPNLYIDPNTYLSAFDVILTYKAIKKEDENLIAQLRELNKDIKEQSTHLLLHYAITKVESSNYKLSLTKEQVFEFVAYFLSNEDNDGLTLERLLQIPNHPEVYRILLEVYKNDVNKQDFLQAAINYIDAENTYNFSLQKTELFIKEIEEVAAGDYNLLQQFYASFLVTFFLSNFLKGGNALDKAKNRLETFKKSVERIGFDSLIEEIQFLLWVKKDISNLADFIFDDSIEDNDNYKFLPETWINELIEKLSFSDCLDLILIDDNVTIANDYMELHAKVYNKLVNINVVKENITSKGDLMERYFQFMNFEDRDQEFEDKGIKEYLESIRAQSNINLDMQNERINFILDCYNTLSNEMKRSCTNACAKALNCADSANDFIEKELLKEYSENDKQREKQIYQKQLIVNIILDYFTRNKYGKVKRKSIVAKYFTPALYVSIIVFIVSLILMFIPPVIKGFLLKTNIILEIKKYFSLIYVLIPLYCFSLFVINFSLQFFNPENTIKKKCIVKSIKVTFIYGFLPILFFLITYFMMYFLGLVF